MSPRTCCGEVVLLVSLASSAHWARIRICGHEADGIAEGLDPLMVKYNESLPYDRIFWRQDIAGQNPLELQFPLEQFDRLV